MTLAKDDQIHSLLSRTTKMVRDFLLEKVFHDLTEEQLAKELGQDIHSTRRILSNGELIAPEAAIMCRALGLDMGFVIRDVGTGKEVTFYAADNFGSKKPYETQTEEIQAYGLDKKGVEEVEDGLDFIPVAHEVVDGSFVVDEDEEEEEDLADLEFLDEDDDDDEDWDEEGEEDELDEEEEDEAHYVKPSPGAEEEEEGGEYTRFCDDPLDKYDPEVRAFFNFSDGGEDFDVEAALGEDSIEAEFEEIIQRDLEDFMTKCENCMELDRLPDSMLCHPCTEAGVICHPPEDLERREDYEPLELMALVDHRAQQTKDHSLRLLQTAGLLQQHNED